MTHPKFNLTIRPIAYADYRRIAESGDILICRSSSIEGGIITRVTGAEYSHASLVGWINPHRRDDPDSSALMIVESVQHHGTRIIPLSGEIRQWSGLYDVYRPKDVYPRLYPFSNGYDGDAAFAWSCRGAGSSYGWLDLARVGCRRYACWPLDRLPAVPNSDDPRFPRDCSCRVHAATRLHGGRILKAKDCDVVPGDFSDPRFFAYRGTLYFHEHEAKAVAEVIAAQRALNAAEADLLENGGDAA